ncbi:MAG: hypothetical protein J3K34DRAFT_391865 [Monoraphidium minutum]|nr:MAG: hypothetical protein J3K34DRAFT_391865 [Monoraphidium minutum]
MAPPLVLPERYARYYRGRHALITGASEGVGLEIAKMVAAAGGRVTLVSRTEAKLRAAEAACLAARGGGGGGGAAVCVAPADVTDEAAVRAAAAAGAAALGDVDLLITCAGAAECGYFHASDSGAARAMMDLNYMGVVHVVRAVLPAMLRRNEGHLVAVASTLSLMGATGYSAYAPSKFAVRGLMEILRNELQGSNVRVSISYPPDMATPGYEREGLTKPPEALEISEDFVYPPDKARAGDYEEGGGAGVAYSILRGMARGCWVTPNVRGDVDLLQDLTIGLVPRGGLIRFLWHTLRSAFGPLICWIVAAKFDAVARRHAKTRFAAFWAEGAAAAGGGGAARGGGGAAQRAKRS